MKGKCLFSLTVHSVCIFLVFHVITNLKLAPKRLLKIFGESILGCFHFPHSMEFQP